MSSKAKPKRKRLKQGARLPYCEYAQIDPRKLTHYALNPDKNPERAAGFAAFGVGLDDWQFVYDTVLQKLPDSPATRLSLDQPDRAEFTVEIEFVGLNDRPGILVTGWCVDARKAPWLSTIIPKPGRSPEGSD